jgi:hypothetical protein
MKIIVQDINISVGPYALLRITPETESEGAILRALWNGNKNIISVPFLNIDDGAFGIKFEKEKPLS